MSVLPQSRYNSVNATTVRMPDSTGTYNLTVLRTVPKTATRFRLYIWSATDRPDTVAVRFFQDPSLWWTIFDINPEIIDPLNVPAGSVVRIPIAPIQGQGSLIQ